MKKLTFNKKSIALPFLVLGAIIASPAVCYSYTAQAYASDNGTIYETNINKDLNVKLYDDLGGSGSSLMNVYFNEEHKEEIQNFTDTVTASDGSYVSCTDNYYGFTYSKTNMFYAIYMVSCLEKLAQTYVDEYYQQSDEEVSQKTKNIKIKNCVLGYIRGINIDYINSSVYDADYTANANYGTDRWTLLCGSIDQDFIAYVKNADGMKYANYFGSFVSASKYNEDYYGTIDSVYLESNYSITDPLGSGQTIDLIHMFAAMDGIYTNTGRNDLVCKVATGSTHFVKDIVSWLGDLQTLTNQLVKQGITINDSNKYTTDMGHADFDELAGISEKKFPPSDLLADIDAYNMTKFFVDCSSTSISDAMIAYYRCVNDDSSTTGNRYFAFIYTSTLQADTGKIGTSSTLLGKFQNKVFGYMNLKYDNGDITDYEYYSQTSYNLKLMCETEYPDVGLRAYSAELFYDYVIAMSYRFN